MTAYIDNNIVIDIEQKQYTKEDLRNAIDLNINKFFYSFPHIFEADEISGTPNEKQVRLKTRFETITKLTENNYLYNELPSNVVHKQTQIPENVYRTITINSATKTDIKNMINSVSQEQREIFRNSLGIDAKEINNYSAEEVISQINERKEAFGGFTLPGLLEEAKRIQSHGKPIQFYDKIIGTMEVLDLVGYWKDKYNEKSNYARTWDGMHTYFSSFCDYFISNDTRTRNKAKVIFQTFGVNTKVVSSRGI